MFLGGLSTTTERKARKEGGSQKAKLEGSSSSSASAASASASAAPSRLKRAKKGALPIIYSATNPTVPRSLMLQYFVETTEMIMDEANMVEIIDEATRSGKGLEVVASEYQRDVLEYNYQIERNYGCRHMSSLPSTAADDPELLQAGLAFVSGCQRSYIELLTLRARRNGNPRRTSGGMPRLAMMEFFEGCNALMGLSETKQMLRDIAVATGTFPNERIVELQKSVLELIGLEPEYGISFLNKVPEDYPQDEELHMKMNQFALCAQVSAKESMMTPEEKDAFYADIPMFLRPFPHVFIFHQQMQQARAQRSAPMAQVQALLSNEETKTKIITLSSRMDSAKSRVESEIVDWSPSRRKEFITSFAESSTLSEFNSAGADPIAKLNRFLEVSDADLDSFLTVQVILSADIKSNGSMLRELIRDGSGASRSLMGSLQALQTFMGAGNATAHVHGPGCGHDVRAPDVTTGVSATMDR